MRRTACSLALAALFAATPAMAKGPEYAREGTAALLNGDYRAAIDHYNRAIEEDNLPDVRKARVYNDRGVAYWRTQQLKEAVKDFNQAVALYPEYAAVYNNRANALLDLGYIEQAHADYGRAIQLEPGYAAAYNNRGNIQLARKEYGPALRDFSKAISLAPASAAAYNGRGRIHALQKRYHSAVRDFTRAVTLDTQYVDAYRNRSRAQVGLKRYVAAVQDLSVALRYAAGDAALHVERGSAYADARNYSAAIRDYTQAIRLDEGLADAYAQRGEIYARIRQYNRALADLNHALQLNEKSPDAYRNRAVVQLATKATGEALTTINRALELRPEDAAALVVRAQIHEATERPDDAVADYRKALQIDPFSDDARNAFARLTGEEPPPIGAPLGAPFNGWVLAKTRDGRYAATNPQYPKLRVPLEMYGKEAPEVRDWSIPDRYAGVGLLRYYAGSVKTPADVELEYTAIVDLYRSKVLAIEPYRRGDVLALWSFEVSSVQISHPQGGESTVKLRPKHVAQRRDDYSSGFSNRPTTRGAQRRQQRGFFRWLFGGGR